jgi:preprotein translocase subunit YajC
MLFGLLMAPRPEGGEGGGGPFGLLVSFLPFILIFFIFYLLVFRPQAKRQKELASMLSALKQGDRVLTQGGIFGNVVALKDDNNVVVLKIADQVKVEVAKSSITSVVKKSREG